MCQICLGRFDCPYCLQKAEEHIVERRNMLGEWYNQLIMYNMQSTGSAETDASIIKEIGDWKKPGAKPYIPIEIKK